MKCLIAIALLLVVHTTASAQTPVTTGPVTTSMRFEAGAPPNVTATEALTFEWRIKDTGVPLTALTGFTCQQVAVSPFTNQPGVTCLAPVGASQADALNRVGKHELTATFFRADVGESPQTQTPFALTSPAAAPTGLRLIR